MKSTTTERDEAFAQVCRRIIAGQRKNRKPIPFEELLTKALTTRPDRHFVEYDSALRRLYALRRGRESCRPGLATQKWHEIYAQVRVVMVRRPQLSFPMAVAFALAYKRPSRFYMPEKHARDILRRVIAAETMVI